jgi:hypothetical protein
MNDALSESLGSRRIAFLVFDGVKMLDFVGPAEVFVESNQQPAVDYEVVILSPGGADVSTSIGTTVSTRPVAGSEQRRSTPTCWSSSGPDAARSQQTYGHNEHTGITKNKAPHRPKSMRGFVCRLRRRERKLVADYE